MDSVGSVMSQAADHEARPNTHYQWLRDIFDEVNELDCLVLAQAILNVDKREVIE